MKTAISLLLFLATAAQAADWPQWRGPQRDGLSSETDLFTAKQPFAEAWRVPLGPGFSGIAIADGRVFTMFAQGADEFAICLDEQTGAELWRHRTGPYYKETQGGDGPRSTPTVDGAVVYVLGATGKLFALAAASGAPIWQKDLVAEFGSEVPRWGFSTSPLVEGNLLLIEAGGVKGNFLVEMVVDHRAPATVVALDKASGQTVWTALDDKMGYSSPIAFTANGQRQLAFFTAYSLIGLSPTDGQTLWTYPWKTRYDVNAATPIFIPPNRVFISSAYDKGAAVVQVGADAAIEEIWRNKEMQNQFSTSVYLQDHLYGFDKTILKCIDARTGAEKWKTRGYGNGSLIAADGHLILLGEQGNLGLAQATPAGFVEKASYPAFDSRCWTVPSLANGRLYLRDESEIVGINIVQATQ